MKYKLHTKIPTVFLLVMLASLLVGFIGCKVVDTRRQAVTGRITDITEYSDEDGTSYTAHATAAYNGRSYDFTRSVSRRAKIGDQINGSVFVRDEDQQLHDRWLLHVIVSGFLFVVVLVWRVIAGVRVAQKKRRRLDEMRSTAENSAGSFSTFKDTQIAFVKPEAAVEEAVQLINQRGLTTMEVAAQLSAEDWELPEMKAAVLRPDIKALEETMLKGAMPQLDRLFENTHMSHVKRMEQINARRAEKGKAPLGKPAWDCEFAEYVPVAAKVMPQITWTDYVPGESADHAAVQVVLSGPIKGSRYVFNCRYTYDLSLPVDLQAAPEIVGPKKSFESITLPSDD